MTNVMVPSIIDYPGLLDVKSNKELYKDMLCYIIEDYSITDGYAVYIGIRDNNILVRISDFKSENIDPQNAIGIHKSIGILSDITKSIGVSDVLYFLSHTNNNYILVDAMLSANKYMGPGMLRDIFGNIMLTQDIVDITPFNDLLLSTYNNKIIKPSKFRYIENNNLIRPLYGRI